MGNTVFPRGITQTVGVDHLTPDIRQERKGDLSPLSKLRQDLRRIVTHTHHLNSSLFQRLQV